MEFGEMLVLHVCAFHVGNRVVGTESGQRVDVAVRIVASEIAVMDPEDAVGSERRQELLLYPVAAERFVPVGSQEAFRRGEDGSLAVALDASSLEDKTEVILVGSLEDVLLHHVAADLVVEIGRKLQSPSVEAEIQQMGPVGLEDGDKRVIARPGIVGGNLVEGNVGKSLLGQVLFKQASHFLWIRRHDQEPLAEGNLCGNPDVAGTDFRQYGCPVGLLVRPGQLNGTLGVPFGR